MRRITPQDYAGLRNDAEVLEADSFGEKVLLLQNGNYIKLFRRKRLLSSAWIWPYAERFARNAAALSAAGIPCPRILGVYRAPHLKRDVVHYAPLPGMTLRQLRERKLADQLHAPLGQFVSRLHQLGIYFRSLHLGNVVLSPDGQLGLIDIADLKCHRRPLSERQRLRNLRHLFRDPRDRHWLTSGPFVSAYLAQSGLNLDASSLLARVHLST
jgi:tRNA A-37 threonylcarbamoyl transferase component Bud32